MSFRQYGGINYAARNNIVKNNYSNANNLSVMTKVGQPSSIINFESDLSANIIYSDLTVDNLTVKYDSNHKGILTVSDINSSSGIMYITNDITNPAATLRIVSSNFDKANFIQSGQTSDGGSAADLRFTSMNAGKEWMVITKEGKVGIGTPSPAKILDVNGDALINGLTVGKGSGSISTNTAIGYQALLNNDGGYQNTAIGYQASYYNNSGNYNTAVGYQASHYNSTGTYNTAVGYHALLNNKDGIYNTAFGAQALLDTTGSSNTAIGLNALCNNVGGYNNTAIGSESGCYYLTNCNNCTFIGYKASSNADYYSKSTAIGAESKITDSNQIMLGTSNENVIIPGKLSANSSSINDYQGAFYNSDIGEGTLLSANGNITEIKMNNNLGTHFSIQNTENSFRIRNSSSNPSPYTYDEGGDLMRITSATKETTFYGSTILNDGDITFRNTTGNYDNNIRQIIFDNGSTDSAYIKFVSVSGDNSYLEIETIDDLVPIHFTVNGNHLYEPKYGRMTLNTNGLSINYEQSSQQSTYALDVNGDALVNGLTVGRGPNSLPSNTAIGYKALTTNGAGIDNTAVGYQALLTNSVSSGNTALGVNALIYTTGSYNTAVGINALYNNNAGSNNTAIGCEAGYIRTYCNNCTFVGFQSTSSGDYSNSTALGCYATITDNNQIMLGTSTETVHIPGDLRAKKRIYIGEENPGNYSGAGGGDTAYLEYVAVNPGSGDEKTVLRIVVENDPTDNINLNPNGNVGINTDDPQYKLDVQGTLRVTGTCTALSFDAASDYRIKENVLNLAGDSNFIVDNLRPITYKNILSGKQDMGFIAHELQEHYPFLVSGEKDGTENQSVNYIGLIALLVKEIQELKQDIKILKTKL